MLHWIWVLIVGGVIGLIAGALTGHGRSMNWIAKLSRFNIGSSSVIRRMGPTSCRYGNCFIYSWCSNFGDRCCILC